MVVSDCGRNERERSYRLPWPPSLNRLWRWTPAGVKLSQAGRDYSLAVCRALPVGKVEKLRWRMAVYITLHAPNARPYDVDNRGKCLLDSCTKACLWQDDGLIDELHVARATPDPDGKGFVDMLIVRLDA